MYCWETATEHKRNCITWNLIQSADGSMKSLNPFLNFKHTPAPTQKKENRNKKREKKKINEEKTFYKAVVSFNNVLFLDAKNKQGGIILEWKQSKETQGGRGATLSTVSLNLFYLPFRHHLPSYCQPFCCLLFFPTLYLFVGYFHAVSLSYCLLPDPFLLFTSLPLAFLVPLLTSTSRRSTLLEA